MIAYENFKESQRRGTKRARRKTLELLLELSTLGGRAYLYTREYSSLQGRI